MQRQSADLQAEILTALGHPNRIRILQYLRNEIRCNCELAPALKLEQSNLSRHLKILVQAGILTSWKDGLRVNFKIADARVFKVLDIALSIARKEAEKKIEVLEEV